MSFILLFVILPCHFIFKISYPLFFFKDLIKLHLIKYYFHFNLNLILILFLLLVNVNDAFIFIVVKYLSHTKVVFNVTKYFLFFITQDLI